MSDDEKKTYGIELLLQEPEVVAWLTDYVEPTADDGEDDEPPRAA